MARIVPTASSFVMALLSVAAPATAQATSSEPDSPAATDYEREIVVTAYTPGNPILGTSGYWTPNASFNASGGATCKMVSQDVSKILTTGAFKAVFSMK